jgi:hypothetical protein
MNTQRVLAVLSRVLLIAAGCAISVTTQAQTFTTWPGPDGISDVTKGSAIKGKNVSGLYYQAGEPDVLWAVQNFSPNQGPSRIHKLVKSALKYVTATGWTNTGKALRYLTTTNSPNAEGITMADPNSNQIYVVAERINYVSGNDGKRNSVLLFDTDKPSPIRASREWVLTIPGATQNEGLEAITFVPDSYLITNEFEHQNGGLYAADPESGGGLFLVGAEHDGKIWVLKLKHTDPPSVEQIAEFQSELINNTKTGDVEKVTAMHFDVQTGQLWVHCDDECDNRVNVFEIQDGAFTRVAGYERPSGLADLNFEGIAISTQCENDSREFFWGDDAKTDNVHIRMGHIDATCTSP